jgi:hypothetical protein
MKPRFLLLLSCTLLTACSKANPPAGIRLKVSGEFAAGSEMSGLASADGKRFVLVSNETRLAQSAVIDFEKHQIQLGQNLPLAGAPGDAEMDLEAVACDASTGTYYVTASHAVSKNKAKPRAEQQVIFRLKLNEAGGLADARLGTLTTLLQSVPQVAESIGQPLQKMGLNIEGLAIWQNKLWVGLRAPMAGEEAVLLEMSPDAPFSLQPAEVKVHKLALGKRMAVRDLAVASDGLLIVAGETGAPASDKFSASPGWSGDADFSIWKWTGVGATPKLLKALAKESGSVEGLYVVKETPTEYQVLTLRDGQRNGGPELQNIPR